jgi:tetratricopeptide (TPR) repeat protein
MLISLLLVLTTTVPAQPDDSEVKPVYVAFANELERGINAREGQVIDDHVDIDRLFERSTKDIPASKKFADGFKKGMRSQGMQFGAQLVRFMDDSSTFRLLNLRVEKGRTRALYRSASDSGLNYIDFDLARDEKGQVIIVDIYPYIAGEYSSETLRRIYLAGMAELEQGLLDKLMGKEQEFLKNMPKMTQMGRLIQERKHQEALDTYGQMAPVMQKQKSVMLMRLMAAMQVGEAEYQLAIDDLEKTFPGDPSLDLISIDGHVMRQDYAAALRSIDRLDRRVKDPYLQFMRASVMLGKPDVPEAKKYLQLAIKQDVTLTQAWWALISLSLTDKQYAETARLLTGIERDAGVELADLNGISEYEGFVKSREGKAWLKKRKAAKH